MGGQFGFRSHNFKLFHPVQAPCPGRPQLDFADQVKESHPFAIESFFGRGFFFHCAALIFPSTCLNINGGRSGSRTRLHGFRVHVITSDPPPAIPTCFRSQAGAGSMFSKPGSLAKGAPGIFPGAPGCR